MVSGSVGLALVKRLGGRAIDVAGAHEQKARVRLEAGTSHERVHAAHHADAHRNGDVLTLLLARHACEVVDGVGAHRLDERRKALLVADVQLLDTLDTFERRPKPGTRQADDAIARGVEMLHQPAAGEPIGADDEGAHGGRQDAVRAADRDRRRSTSASTIILMSSSKPTVACQPSSRFALDASPHSDSTSLGRRFEALTVTWSR